MGTTDSRLAVLASGKGSNFKALLNHIRAGTLPNVQITLLITNTPKAGAIDIAQAYDTPVVIISPRNFATRREYDSEINHVLLDHRIDLVILAGYMRIIGDPILTTYRGRILNIHPSLLPNFPGLHAPKQALDRGVSETGCTVHFVDETLDGGPVILQRRVPILPNDTVDTLTKRIQAEEHAAYAEAIRKVLANEIDI